MENYDPKPRSSTYKPPFGNYIVMLLISIIFAIQFLGDPQKLYLSALILKNASFNSILGYFWLHTGVIHIASNLVLLAIFGRYTCTKMGNAKYILVYIAMGFAAALAHILLDGRPVIGASGAIFGVLGMAVVLSWRKLSPLGPWLIFIWIALSVAIAISGNSQIAHVAHVAGFVTGMITAAILIIFNQADCSDTDYSLMRIVRQVQDNLSYGYYYQKG